MIQPGAGRSGGSNGADRELAARFLRRLARALHRYGTPVHRIERALGEVASRLDVPAQFLVTPTSIVTSIGEEGRAETSLLRVDQEEADLSKLAEVHEVVRGVLSRTLALEDASLRLEALASRPPLYGAAASVASFAAASTTVALFFDGSWREAAVAAVLGTIIGLLVQFAGRSERFALIFPAVAGIVCAAGASLAQPLVGRLFPFIPTLAGLIVLLPGLTLTIAVNELAHRHIVSGSARLIGALTTFLQIAFGVALGQAVASRFVGDAAVTPPDPVPFGVVLGALVVTALALTVLFRARPKDAPVLLAMIAVAFFGTRLGTEYLGLELGTCVGAWLLGTSGAWISRWRDVPSAIPVLPAMLLLVPGSLGFRSLSALLAKDVVSGVETAFTMLLIALSLVTGLLLANLTVKPRRLF